MGSRIPPGCPGVTAATRTPTSSRSARCCGCAIRACRCRRRSNVSAAAALRSRSRSSPACAAAAPRSQPTVLPKPAVLALSRAIEDEYCARAAGGVLIGSFQRERFYRRAERRWRELARTADLAVALADFSALGGPRGRTGGGADQPPPRARPGVGGARSAPRGSRHAWPHGSGRARPRCPTPGGALRCCGPSSPRW